MGKDTHSLTGAAEQTALEVLAASCVETIIQGDDGFTPTPVLSRAFWCTKAHGERDADGIVVTPPHNPPQDGGFKYNRRRVRGSAIGNRGYLQIYAESFKDQALLNTIVEWQN
jgi:phosphoglucomutase